MSSTLDTFQLEMSLLNLEFLNIHFMQVTLEVFHLEIDNGNNTKSTIEIHLKNPLEKDLTLEKGNKNV